MDRRVVEAPKEHCDRLTRHSAANETHRRWARDGDISHISRREEGIPIAEHQLSVALTHSAASPDIHAEQEIVLAVCDGLPRSYCVAQNGQRSRHDSEAWQRPLGQIDVNWIVGQRLQWLP